MRKTKPEMVIMKGTGLSLCLEDTTTAEINVCYRGEQIRLRISEEVQKAFAYKYRLPIFSVGIMYVDLGVRFDPREFERSLKFSIACADQFQLIGR